MIVTIIRAMTPLAATGRQGYKDNCDKVNTCMIMWLL